MNVTTQGIFYHHPLLSTMDPDARAFLVATGVTDRVLCLALNQLVLDLKQYGLWALMVALYPMLGGTAAAHAVNLKSPGTHDIAWYGGMTHSANGVQFDGVTGYGNTTAIPPNDMSVSFYSRTNLKTLNTVFFGSYSGGSQTLQGFYQPGWGIGFDMYALNTTRLVAPRDPTGLLLCTRTGEEFRIYRQDELVGLRFDAAFGSAPSTPVWIGGIGVNGVLLAPTPTQCALFHIGGGMTPVQEKNFNTAVDKYQTSLSRQIA